MTWPSRSFHLVCCGLRASHSVVIPWFCMLIVIFSSTSSLTLASSCFPIKIVRDCVCCFGWMRSWIIQHVKRNRGDLSDWILSESLGDGTNSQDPNGILMLWSHAQCTFGNEDHCGCILKRTSRSNWHCCQQELVAVLMLCLHVNTIVFGVL